MWHRFVRGRLCRHGTALRLFEVMRMSAIVLRGRCQLSIGANAYVPVFGSLQLFSRGVALGNES